METSFYIPMDQAIATLTSYRIARRCNVLINITVPSSGGFYLLEPMPLEKADEVMRNACYFADQAKKYYPFIQDDMRRCMWLGPGTQIIEYVHYENDMWRLRVRDVDMASRTHYINSNTVVYIPNYIRELEELEQ